MADITMCNDKECPSKDKCWRFTAPPTPNWQSYFAEPVRNEGQEKCEHFWQALKRLEDEGWPN